jgi:precorrin-8X/cobalt-precorrin-8 methylmutase
MTGGIHPIEAESYGILAERIDLSHLSPGVRAVVARVIHASADLEYAETMRAAEGTVESGVEAIRHGAPVVTDVEMTRAGITGVNARCYLGEGDGPTRSAAGIRHAAQLHPHGAIVVIGCAPTALEEALTCKWQPALVIGMPVGFVGAAAAKEAARASGLPVITNIGEKGGAGVAAAACNAIVRMANGQK